MNALHSIPIVFTPLNGLMAVADAVASAFERRFNVRLWHGDEGLRGVIQQKLTEMGVPEKPIQLTGSPDITPRAFAEHIGFIRRKKTLRRVK